MHSAFDMADLTTLRITGGGVVASMTKTTKITKTA